MGWARVLLMAEMIRAARTVFADPPRAERKECAMGDQEPNTPTPAPMPTDTAPPPAPAAPGAASGTASGDAILARLNYAAALVQQLADKPDVLAFMNNLLRQEPPGGG